MMALPMAFCKAADRKAAPIRQYGNGFVQCYFGPWPNGSNRGLYQHGHAALLGVAAFGQGPGPCRGGVFGVQRIVEPIMLAVHAHQQHTMLVAAPVEHLARILQQPIRPGNGWAGINGGPVCHRDTGGKACRQRFGIGTIGSLGTVGRAQRCMVMGRPSAFSSITAVALSQPVGQFLVWSMHGV